MTVSREILITERTTLSVVTGPPPEVLSSDPGAPMVMSTWSVPPGGRGSLFALLHHALGEPDSVVMSTAGSVLAAAEAVDPIILSAPGSC